MQGQSQGWGEEERPPTPPLKAVLTFFRIYAKLGICISMKTYFKKKKLLIQRRNFVILFLTWNSLGSTGTVQNCFKNIEISKLYKKWDAPYYTLLYCWQDPGAARYPRDGEAGPLRVCQHLPRPLLCRLLPPGSESTQATELAEPMYTLCRTKTLFLTLAKSLSTYFYCHGQLIEWTVDWAFIVSVFSFRAFNNCFDRIIVGYVDRQVL